jgi:deoxyribonuclease-4
MYLGCHLSTSNGFLAMGKQALELGADTFQFFSRNPRGGATKAFDKDDLTALVAFLKEHNFGPLVAHAPYTMNPASVVVKTRDFARLALTEDLQKLNNLPGAIYNLHPGSHIGLGADEGLSKTAELLNEVMSPDQTTTVVLETMAGKGTELGRSFGELATLLSKIRLDSKVGVCLDTCHIYDGGYDIKNDSEEVLALFSQELGLDRLKAVHINDSKNTLASHKDRHAKLGEGDIGLEAIAKLVWHPKLQHLPFILETPNDLEGYRQEIEALRALKPKKGPKKRPK